MQGYQGTITSSYKALCQAFGTPTVPYDKSSVEWHLLRRNISIYDNYRACPKNDTEHVFCVGGEKPSDVQVVLDLLQKAAEKVSG